MKKLSLTLLALTIAPVVLAIETLPYEGSFYKEMVEENVATNYNQEMKIAYLNRIMSIQQKSYEDKIAYLETELRKTKDRLIEKSLNQEKIQDAMKEAHRNEVLDLKRELAYKTKTMLDYQRQVEKMKPSEDMKNVIKLNTQLASELRRSEDQIAIFQLKMIEGTRTPGGNRMPASVIEGK